MGQYHGTEAMWIRKERRQQLRLLKKVEKDLNSFSMNTKQHKPKDVFPPLTAGLQLLPSNCILLFTTIFFFCSLKLTFFPLKHQGYLLSWLGYKNSVSFLSTQIIEHIKIIKNSFKGKKFPVTLVV